MRREVMKNRVWMNVIMAILVAGLFFTVSCAKKTVVTDVETIEDVDKTKADAEAKAQADAEAEAARIAQEQLDDQMAAEKAAKEAVVMAAKDRFVNLDISFEYDSSVLNNLAKSTLKEKAAWMKANSGVSVAIEGHCDERGTTDYNLALGERRANAAKAYLINLGISASRMSTISYGEEKPMAYGSSESAFQKNRRAHFVIE